MDVGIILLIARLLLATVLLLAGVTKLVDREGLNESLVDFGLPPVVARFLGRLLPAAEIVIAVALAPVNLAWYAASGALALFTIFIIGIGVTLARGLRPDCRCFGQLHSATIGWPTLARNGIFAACAGWLVSKGPSRVGPSLWASITAANANERRLFIIAACLVVFLFFRALRRKENPAASSVSIESQLAWESETVNDSAARSRFKAVDGHAPSASTQALRPEKRSPTAWSNGNGLPIGTPAPEFELPGITGQKNSLTSIRALDKPVVLVFSSPFCKPCQALSPMVGRWMREHSETLNFVVISRGTVNENQEKLKDIDVSRLMFQKDFEVATTYQCTATPAAVLVGVDGLILSDLAVGAVAIKQLIASSSKLPDLEAQSGNSQR